MATVVGLNAVEARLNGAFGLTRAVKRVLRGGLADALVQASILVEGDGTVCACRAHAATAHDEEEGVGCARWALGKASFVSTVSKPGVEHSACVAEPVTRRRDAEVALMVATTGFTGTWRASNKYRKRHCSGCYLAVDDFGAGYCYVGPIEDKARTRVARILGPLPYLIPAAVFISKFPNTGVGTYRLVAVKPGYYHFEPGPGVFQVSEMMERVAEIVRAEGPHVRVGIRSEWAEWLQHAVGMGGCESSEDEDGEPVGFQKEKKKEPSSESGGAGPADDVVDIGLNSSDLERLVALLAAAKIPAGVLSSAEAGPSRTSVLVEEKKKPIYKSPNSGFGGFGDMYGNHVPGLVKGAREALVSTSRVKSIVGYFDSIGIKMPKSSHIDLALATHVVSTVPVGFLGGADRLKALQGLGDATLRGLAAAAVVSSASTVHTHMAILSLYSNAGLRAVAKRWKLQEYCVMGSVPDGSKARADLVEQVIGVVAFWRNHCDVAKFARAIGLGPPSIHERGKSPARSNE